MYLSKLELHGFKSFADRTTLQFAPGVTAIVGPNGCGKSNIVDAVRWVIGEQRARVLRSNKMENIIFNGTSKRRQLGLAQVMLTIENTRGVLPTEYSEVTLGRRLYRSGESEYLLNGVKCRLRDIVDLFMDTGMGAGAYSVIELKMIEDILSDNAQDRRHLFEEAAGITKYKLRRAQTLRKLGSTQNDLDRLRDLIEEIEKNVRRLKRQARKASRYKELKEHLQYLELALSQLEYNRLSEHIDQLHTSRTQLNDQITQQTSQLATAEAQLEAAQKTLVDREQHLAIRQQALNVHLEQERALESDRRLEEQSLQTAQRDQQRITRAQADAEQRRAQLERNHHQLTSAFEQAKPALASANEALEEAQAERDRLRQAADAQQAIVQTLRQKERQAVNAQAEAQRRLDRVANRLDLHTEEQNRLQHEADLLDTSAEDLAATVRHQSSTLEAAQIRVDEAKADLQAVEQAVVEHEAVLEKARTVLRQTEQQRAAIRAEAQVLESLVTSYEDFSDAVQFLATTPSWRTDELLTVADVLGCDAENRVALDAVLGEAASYIVVAQEQDVRQALALLRQEQRGQATFLVLERLGSLPELEEPPLFPRLRDHVRVANPIYAPLADLLLHGWYLTDTLENAEDALSTLPETSRVVAQTGEWLSTQGLVHGGSLKQTAAPTSSRLDRREQWAHVQHQQAELATAYEHHQAGVQEAEEALQALSIATARQAVADAEREAAHAEKTYTRAVYEQETHQRRQETLAQRIRESQGLIETAETDVRLLRDRVAEANTETHELHQNRAAAEVTFQEADRSRRLASEQFNEANIAAVQARNRYDNVERDLERTQRAQANVDAQMRQHTDDLTHLRAVIASAQETIQALSRQLHTAQNERVSLQESAQQAETARTQTRASISETEMQLRTIRRDRETLMRQENAQAVRLTELQTRTDELLRHLKEDFGVSLVDDTIEIEADFVEKQARTEVLDLRKTIRGLGPINELALETYEEEKSRLDFLTKQLNDLESAEHTLLETIREINTTATARFEETFSQIQLHFGRIFEELFGETASAELLLVDPKDPLETPIDIKAKPRGKKPSTIAQLSGGEKTLTATALLFAIYLVKPSPFCILDEVDAPLDDANIDRFMNLIRAFSDETQFILVTHNKRSMELADRLYGVTMQEQGISKLVSVAFDEAETVTES